MKAKIAHNGILTLETSNSDLGNLISIVSQVDLIREDQLGDLTNQGINELLDLMKAKHSIAQPEQTTTLNITTKSINDLSHILSGALTVDDDLFENVDDDQILTLFDEINLITDALNTEETIRLIEKQENTSIPRIPGYKKA